MDYHGLSWIIEGQSWIIEIIVGRLCIVDYRRLLWTITDYELSRIIADYNGLSWIIADDHGLSWIIVDY